MIIVSTLKLVHLSQFDYRNTLAFSPPLISDENYWNQSMEINGRFYWTERKITYHVGKSKNIHGWNWCT